MSDPTDFSRLVFGRLSWEAIPLHEPILIATFAAREQGPESAPDLSERRPVEYPEYD